MLGGISLDDIAKLRLYLNDKEGKKFTDPELQMLLEESDCVYCAAAEGWTLIATGIGIAGTKKYTVGIETYEKSSVNEQINAALNNAAYFKGKCTSELRGSFILRVNTEVRR